MKTLIISPGNDSKKGLVDHESRKIQKGPPIGRESVSKENSDFLGGKTNRKSEKT